ncbi:MAG: PBECR2 nuclease fold domain-containing protein, partial [Oscillospiraceae bacterium]
MAVDDVYYIGKIDINIYKCVSEDIVTDEVIITDNQISHIKERHPTVYENFGCNFSEIIGKPDYILEANKPNTAIILKRLKADNGFIKTVLRLITSKDNPLFKNSIITFMRIDEKSWNRCVCQEKTDPLAKKILSH